MSKLFSPDCNAVNFGGSPTKRPVSSDEYVIDKDSGAKRLKRCDEHYIKFVTELWFSVRLVVMSRQMRNLPRDVADESTCASGPRKRATATSWRRRRTPKSAPGFHRT